MAVLNNTTFMPEPLVSVIIPTHNRQQLLINAISSVLGQTYSNYEIIVIDDCGESESAIKPFGDVVHYINIPQTPYPAESRNVGLQYARGKYIAFLDDDDTWLPEKLASQVEILERSPDIGLVCSNAIAGTDDERQSLVIMRDVKNTGDMLNQEIMGDFIITSSTVIRASLLERTGLYYSHPDMLIGEDYDFSSRFAAVSQVYYDPRPLVRYYVNPDSIQDRQSKSYVRYYRGVLNVMYRLRQFLLDNQRLTLKSRMLILYRIHDTKCDIILNRLVYERELCERKDYARLLIPYAFLIPFAIPKVARYVKKRIVGSYRSPDIVNIDH